MTHEKKFGVVLVWLRRDLRLEDNAALTYASQNAQNVIPLFILDESILQRLDISPSRVAFLIDALDILDRNLQDIGGRLIVLNGKTPDTLIEAAREFKAEAVVFHREYEPFGRARDAKVQEELTAAGIKCETVNNLLVFEPDEIYSKSNTPYTVFTPYKRVWFDRTSPPPEPKVARIAVPSHIRSNALPTNAKQDFECGGEDAALRLLDDFILTRLFAYPEARDVLSQEGTSRLSRHLHFGTISPRTIVWKVRQAMHHADFRTIEAGKTFLSELAWREFYFQILFHFPYVADGAFRKQYQGIEWENDEAHFEAWKDGRTGYPIVDAAMRQMKAESWMHNRGRMIVASFLTKDLLIDWRAGEKYFMQTLVDGDQAANNGGWQWAAGTGTDAQPFFRIFNPTSQGEKFDPDGTYVRRWIPELTRVPNSKIHKPWALSPTERDFLGCAAYPSPIIDHATQRLKALSLYQAVPREEPTQ